MTFRNQRRLRVIKSYIIGWIFAFLFLSVIRGSGTIEQGSVQFEFWRTFLVALIFGFIFGAISGYAQVLTEERIYKRISLKKMLLFRIVYALLFLTSLILISFAMVTMLFKSEVTLLTFVFEPGSLAIYLYILSVDIFMFFYRQINLLLGESNFNKLIRGKFYVPHEEDRIFMFIDLQSSTEIAEKLGHIKYSMMIQDCFNDLGVVVENEAEIYQYVGDEVILTWRLQDGLRNQNCINAYYNFKQQLIKKQDYYLKNYNWMPFFKAGINSGVVTVTEVGKYKKEIAYHGDTINTAARIQGLCNELKQELLLSENLKNILQNDNFSFKHHGSLILKGKEEEVRVFSVLQPI